MQLAAREHRLEHVAGVHRAVGLARADDGVQLVDEQQDLALAVLDLVEHGLEPLLELAAVLRAGDQAAHVEREHGAVLEPFGHVAAHDALREALGDGGLADAGLADQHRVVLGLAGQDANDAPDLVVSADDRVDLALAAQLDQVTAVALERLVGRLGVGALHALVAAHVLERRQKPRLVDRERLEQLLDVVLGRREQRQEHVLDRDILVLHLLRLLLDQLQRLRELGRQEDLVGLVSSARDLGLLAQLGLQAARDVVDRDVHALEQPADQTVSRLDQPQQQVASVELLMAELDGLLLGGLQGFLRLLGELVHVHGRSPG